MALVMRLTEGKVYRLARPDRVSKQHLIGQGQGYLYLCLNPHMAYYVSLATGEQVIFFRKEMQAMEPADGEG